MKEVNNYTIYLQNDLLTGILTLMQGCLLYAHFLKENLI